MVEIHSGGGDTRSTSGLSVNVGCAANGFAVPPKIPAIWIKADVDCSLRPKTGAQEIIRREIEKRFARLFGFGWRVFRHRGGGRPSNRSLLRRDVGQEDVSKPLPTGYPAAYLLSHGVR